MNSWKSGLVVQHGANRYLILEDGGNSWHSWREEELWACRLRGRFQKDRRQKVQLAVIGDRVRFTPSFDTSERAGSIEEILPRHNQISRPQPSGGPRRKLEQVVMANLDRLWVVVSLAQPPLNLRFVDRILAASRHQGIDVGIIFNKADLSEAADPLPLSELYEGLGYLVRICSAQDRRGLDQLGEDLKGKLNVFVGLSGVGKSSLLSAIQPGLELRVSSVGEKSGHGRHTTTASRLYPLDLGALVADTPGMREFGLWGLFQKDLSAAFVEMEERAGDCRFRDCLHLKEPDCAIRQALDEGEIALSRFESYEALIEELPVDELDLEGKR